MKKLKIRFIKYYDIYFIQRKTFFGWRDISYQLPSCDGGYIRVNYSDESKEKLLEKVLGEQYRMCKKHVEITEFPTIKIY